ncbi:MAG: cyclic nucleotide-binding domain-containing protein [SAR324 cluster bacterium]|nr:cyclic nucleotide-binding domain-containing protein [SAR324 cluster bacterium]
MSPENIAIPREIIKKLKAQISFFNNFLDEEMIELLQLSARREYGAGEPIFLEKEEGNEMYVILSGDVKIVKQADGKANIVLASLSVGDCFGEMSMIDGSQRSASAFSDGSLILLVLQEVVLKKNLSLAYKLFKNFSTLMANRLRIINKGFTDVSADEAKSRAKFGEIIKKYAERGGSFKGANLRASQFTNVLFSKAEMKSALFVDSDFKGGRFQNNVFDAASFVGANFTNIMFADCDFKGANLSATVFDRVMFKNCKFDNNSLNQMEAKGVSITKNEPTK